MTDPITTIEEFIDWTTQLQGGLFLYRGLPDADWEVESSAYRRVCKSEKILSATLPAITFQNYIDYLLDEAGLLGFRERQDRKFSDLELLAELQHYGAATCLIDFTTQCPDCSLVCMSGRKRPTGQSCSYGNGKYREILIHPL